MGLQYFRGFGRYDSGNLAAPLVSPQKPGKTNSLGLVKIIFPNSDNVYLHGTDVPELFSEDVRDFSHGCIRVEKPAELAAWVLRNNPGWDLERVRATMHGNKDNLQVNLTTRIPVLIVYGTAAVNQENQILRSRTCRRRWPKRGFSRDNCTNRCRSSSSLRLD
jgi:murein L,D-transpeptidase YcbB/YkuD